MSEESTTPLSVLFDLVRRQADVSNKELASIILSGKPLADGRSPRSRIGDRTWMSRYIVHAPVSMLSEQYFGNYAVSAMRLVSRMKSRQYAGLDDRCILELACGDEGRAMDDALRATGQDVAPYRNMMERIRDAASLSMGERAEAAFVLLVSAACSGSVRRCVTETQRFIDDMYSGSVRTPEPAAGCDLLARGSNELLPERWLGLVRVVDGMVVGDAQWVPPTAEGAVVGSLALDEGAAAQVGPDVSGEHLRLWREDVGWFVQGLGSRNGTVLVSGLTGERTVVEPTHEERRQMRRAEKDASGAEKIEPEAEPAMLRVFPGDQLELAKSTTFLLVEGIPG